MNHGRDDYKNIQDLDGIIPEDEPVILLRASDRHFHKLLTHYLLLLKADTADNEEKIKYIQKRSSDAMLWEMFSIYRKGIQEFAEETPFDAHIVKDKADCLLNGV